MARYEVTGPDGTRYVVEAPANATNEQVMQKVRGYIASNRTALPAPTKGDQNGQWWANDPVAPTKAGGNYFDQFDPPATQPKPNYFDQFDQAQNGQWWANDPVAQPAPDLAKIKRNIRRMLDQNAPEEDIDAYVASEGVTLEQLRAHKSQPNPPARSWADVPGEALQNAPASAARTAYAMAYPFLHPIETAQAVGNIAYGAGSKIAGAVGIDQDPQRKAANEAQINAIGQFFADRYGSIDAIKKSLAEDPVGVAADLSLVLSGGAAMPARAGGIVGKTAQTAAKAGSYLDPVANAGRLARGTGRAVAEAFGTTTGAGSKPLMTAFDAGRRGNTTFRENMRGQAPITDTLDMAKSAMSQLRQDRSDAYALGMSNTDASFKRLDLRPVAHAVATAAHMVNLQGKTRNFSRSAEAAETVRQITAKLEEFNALDDVTKLTPRGVDALKQAIGEIRQSTKHGTLSRTVADRVYNSVKQQITRQVPEYAETMRGYSQASDTLDDLTKTFSLGENAAKDTAIRKLTSTMRNNVNTNYGRREQLLDVLATKEPDLPYAVGGQALNTWAPRGVSNPVIGGAGLLGYSINPAMLPAFAAASPRLVGETAYAMGKGAGGVEKVLSALNAQPPKMSAAARGGYVTNALSQPALVGSQTGDYPTPDEMTWEELLGFYKNPPAQPWPAQ